MDMVSQSQTPLSDGEGRDAFSYDSLKQSPVLESHLPQMHPKGDLGRVRMTWLSSALLLAKAPCHLQWGSKNITNTRAAPAAWLDTATSQQQKNSQLGFLKLQASLLTHPGVY